MAEQSAPRYKISVSAVIAAKVEVLANEARQLGIGEAFLAGLEKALKDLAVNPLEWGDPTNNAKYPGAMIFFGARIPVVIRYTVYEQEKLVWLLNLLLLRPTGID
jgi:hypothetical protein